MSTTTVAQLLEGVCTGFHYEASTLDSPNVCKLHKGTIEDNLVSGEPHTAMFQSDHAASKDAFTLADIPHINKFKNSNENELMNSVSTEYCELPLGISLLNVNSFEEATPSSTAEANALIHPLAGQNTNVDTLLTYPLQGTEGQCHTFL